MVQVHKIREIAEGSRPDLDSHLNCGGINHAIADSIETQLGIQASVEHGAISPRRAYGEEHAFVVLPMTNVEGVSRGPLIVDGALDQFSEENKSAGLVSVSIAPAESFRDVEVLSPADSWFDYYNGWSHYEYV